MDTENEMTNFERSHASLQTAMRNWLFEQMPHTAKALQQRFMMPSGYYMTEDEVAMHMASAAMAVLEIACSSTGLKGA